MKLRVEKPPAGYTDDMAVTMINEDDGEFIVVGCKNAYAVACEIAEAVNRATGQTPQPAPSSPPGDAAT